MKGKMSNPAKGLHALFDQEWTWSMNQFPEYATFVGDPRNSDRWVDLSLDAVARRREHWRDVLRRVESIDRSLLGADDQLNYDLFHREVKLEVEGQQFCEEYLPVTHMSGVHRDVPDLLQIAPRSTTRDFEALVARLRAIPVLVDQTIVLMREGLARHLTSPQTVLRPVQELISNQVVDDPSLSPIARLLLNDLPAELAGGAGSGVRRDVLRAVGEAVVPAYRRLATFITDEYLPKARTSIGLVDLPDGAAWYRHRIRVMTTSDLEPEAIHELGMLEVTRIRREMESTKARARFEGTLAEFFDFLRTDPQFFFTDKETLLVTYRDIAKRIDPELPRLFRTLPRLPYGVVAVPAYSEKVQTTAYYMPGAPEAGRAGYFHANTYDLKARPTWEMEALVAHEAVPGHHLQIALAQELHGLPRFRRFGGNTAYIEGWALYAESLGSDLGLYRDPHSKFGQLTYEMWRAIRLVVDTGMHVFGWTRERAISFFEEHAGRAGHDIRVEVDRYIAWPAQALAYKIGELKIKELRQHAVDALGDRFDLRGFHDMVLGAGPLPLSLLETRAHEWVNAATRAERPHSPTGASEAAP